MEERIKNQKRSNLYQYYETFGKLSCWGGLLNVIELCFSWALKQTAKRNTTYLKTFYSLDRKFKLYGPMAMELMWCCWRATGANHQSTCTHQSTHATPKHVRWWQGWIMGNLGKDLGCWTKRNQGGLGERGWIWINISMSQILSSFPALTLSDLHQQWLMAR